MLAEAGVHRPANLSVRQASRRTVVCVVRRVAVTAGGRQVEIEERTCVSNLYIERRRRAPHVTDSAVRISHLPTAVGFSRTSDPTPATVFALRS